jgi:hypothetical protein
MRAHSLIGRIDIDLMRDASKAAKRNRGAAGSTTPSDTVSDDRPKVVSLEFAEARNELTPQTGTIALERIPGLRH